MFYAIVVLHSTFICVSVGAKHYRVLHQITYISVYRNDNSRPRAHHPTSSHPTPLAPTQNAAVILTSIDTSVPYEQLAADSGPALADTFEFPPKSPPTAQATTINTPSPKAGVSGEEVAPAVITVIPTTKLEGELAAQFQKVG